MDSPLRSELLVAIGAVQQAAKLSRAVLSNDDKGVIEKDDLSPVTVGDFAIQALLTATIHHAFPNDKFVGEESSADLRANPALLDRVWGLLQRVAADRTASAACKVPESKDRMCEMIDWCGSGVPGGPDAGRVWVFDPIDGTKTFMMGQMYAINVALLEHGKQALSVVGCPLLAVDAKAPISNESIDPSGTGSILFAVKGHGAYIRPLPGSPDEVQPRRIDRHAETGSVEQLRLVTCATVVDSGIDDIHRKVSKKLGVPFPGCDLLGWVPRWSTLALGIANMTVWVYKRRDRYAKIWDHAGAMLLFEEAGGKITDVDGKDVDLSVGRKMTANFGFVAAPRSIHATVLEAVREVMREDGKGHMLL